MSEQLSTPGIAAALERAVALGERSVQVAAYLGDELIVDAWVGDVDRSTVFPVFSIGKAVTALAVHLQAERGQLDIAAPVARYWGEYGSGGKDRITIREVLSHRAGVPQMPADISPERLADWEWVIERLTQVEPMFDPGTTNAYHSMSFGWLLGEVVRRTDPQRRPFARFVLEELCEPLGIDSLWLGIPDSVEHRVAELSFPDRPPAPNPDALVNRAVPPAVALTPEIFNRAGVHRACVPAVGAIADARSLARLFALLANGGRLGNRRVLSEDRLRTCLEPRPDFEREDVVYGRHLPSGIGGLWIQAPGVTSPERQGNVLCHPGAGGAIAWAELDAKLAVAICHDRMFGSVEEHPFAALADAVRAVAHQTVRQATNGRTTVNWTPSMPPPDEIRDDERPAYDSVVERQTAYGYVEFVKRFHHDSVLRSFPGDRVQPYFGALLNSPLIAAGISDLGAVYRARGEHPGGMTHADREWVDMVICDELGCNWVLYVHAPDAAASGVRPEAILAVVQGRDEELAPEEKLKADFIRAFCHGTVTEGLYKGVEAELGVRGTVEFTGFCGHLLMTMRLMQAFGVPDIAHEELEEFVGAIVEGRVELPEGARVSTVGGRSGSA